MIHITTRTPPTLSFETKPSPILGFMAKAFDSTTGASADAWGPTEVDARQRAEFLVQLKGA